MAQANSFQHISVVAINVLARQAAKRAVQDELRSQGVRVSQPRSAPGLRSICNRIRSCIEQRLRERSSWASDLLGNQITPNRALKRLRFLVQLLRFPGARAY